MEKVFKTNWDVVKEMSMDEFVDWMYPESYKEIPPWCDESCYDCTNMKKCKNCFTEWLSQASYQKR